MIFSEKSATFRDHALVPLHRGFDGLASSIARSPLRRRNRRQWPKCFTSHCKKSSNLSRRQTTHEVDHRPTSQAVISFLALQRARSDCGLAKSLLISIWKISDNPALPDDVSWSARLPETHLSHPSSNRRSRIRAPTSPLM